MRLWWQRYAGSVALVSVIVFSSKGFATLDHTLNSLRAGNIEGCTQANESRATERKSRRVSIQQTESFDPAILFPNADPEYIKALGRVSIRQDRHAIRVNQPVDCEERYPDSSVLSVP